MGHARQRPRDPDDAAGEAALLEQFRVDAAVLD